MERASERSVSMERGRVSVLYRPRREREDGVSRSDVQRLLIHLAPTGSRVERVIAVGRKLIPRSGSHGRFWGFVDLVLDRADMQAALGAMVYGTTVSGIRHLPAPQIMAAGDYSLHWHDDHAHLRWRIERVGSQDPIARESVIENEADYIVAIANPDPGAWGLENPPDLQGEFFDELEVHATIPASVPPSLQARFDGRYSQLDTTEWLDRPGTELVFIGADRERSLARASGE